MSVKRNRFLTTAEVYKERLEICRACEHYFKPTGSCKKCGCFMKLKAKIGPVSCPIKKWLHSGSVAVVKDLDEDLIAEVMEIYPFIKDRKAANHKVREYAIEVYNTIHGTAYAKNTSCGSCLYSVWKGLDVIYQKYKK